MAMSDEEPDDIPPCKSCGVPWGDHLGMAGTCAKLVLMTKQVKRLRRMLQQGPLDGSLLIEICNVILGGKS
jgi:hypothetical protein